MRILVTGGAGFIGSHLVDLLIQAGHEPFVIDDLSSGSKENLPANVPVSVVDVRDRAAVARVFADVKPDAVAHQAAQMSVSRSVREPHFDAEVNVIGLVNTLDAAVAAGVKRIVFASSGGVLYGDVTSPAPETTPADPISPYGIAKWVGERYLKFYAVEHGLNCTALRYANVYGPRQNPHGEAGVVAIFCTKMLKGEPATVNGDGKYVRDYVYVTDVAKANLLSLEKPSATPFRAFNVGTGIPSDVNDLATKLRAGCQQALSERKISTTVPAALNGPPRAGDLRSNLVSYALIQKELGWKPEVSLDPGLKETVDWFAKKLLSA
jgi:UDP-glucose 4-epimerase